LFIGWIFMPNCIIVPHFSNDLQLVFQSCFNRDGQQYNSTTAINISHLKLLKTHKIQAATGTKKCGGLNRLMGSQPLLVNRSPKSLWRSYILEISQEKCENTKGVINATNQRRTDNTMVKRTNTYLQNTTQKTKD